MKLSEKEKIVWMVGKFIMETLDEHGESYSAWDICGIYEDELVAISHCKEKNNFYMPYVFKYFPCYVDSSMAWSILPEIK